MQASTSTAPTPSVPGQTRVRVVVTAVISIHVIALSLWMGGLIVLGAIVAPTVFGIVPAPSSADAMTVVFRRFDSVAISCAVIALVAEALRAKFRQAKPTRVDLVRVASVILAAGFAITEGVWLSPAIQALHNAGAIRNMNPAGIELEHLHKIAEMLAKAELVLLVAAIVLIIVREHQTPAKSEV